MAEFVAIPTGEGRSAVVNLDHIVAVEELGGGVFLTTSVPTTGNQDRLGHFMLSPESWAVLKRRLLRGEDSSSPKG